MCHSDKERLNKMKKTYKRLLKINDSFIGGCWYFLCTLEEASDLFPYDLWSCKFYLLEIHHSIILSFIKSKKSGEFILPSFAKANESYECLEYLCTRNDKETIKITKIIKGGI